jgi:hypothetical protein
MDLQLLRSRVKTFFVILLLVMHASFFFAAGYYVCEIQHPRPHGQ